MAHIHFIDGALYGDAFGETDSTTGIWKQKASPSVTYGTNGFFLKFANSGSGTDSSGNSNTFTISGSLIQTQDTPSNNFASMNPLSNSTGDYTFANLNNKVVSSTQWLNSNSTLGMIKGKWYWEVKYISGNFGTGIGQVGNGSTSVLKNSTANNGYAVNTLVDMNF